MCQAYTTQHDGAVRWSDLKTWEDVSTKLSFPDEGTAVRMRHGTARAVPIAIVARLRESGLYAGRSRSGETSQHRAAPRVRLPMLDPRPAARAASLPAA